MPKINNSEIIKNIIDDAKINVQVEKVPTQLAEKVVPVLIVKSAPERAMQIKSNNAFDSTSATIHTCSTTRDTYLCAVHMTISKDASSTGEYSNIAITPFGQPAVSVILMRYRTLIAGEFQDSFNFSTQPIKLEKGSLIQVKNAGATASIDTSGTIFFYEVER